MTLFQNAITLAASVTLCATSGHAQTAALDSVENIAAVMQACVVITHANDYDAEGQGVEIAWDQITQRVSSFGLQDDATNVSANVWSSNISHNSFCDFIFQDIDLAQESFAAFIGGQTVVTSEEQSGICVDGTFIIVAINDADSVAAQAMNAQGHVTIHNAPSYGEDPCAS
jgi:hypothetical protein